MLTGKLAQFFSTAYGADLVNKQDGVPNTVREMLSGMCHQESFFLQKCVSAMLSQLEGKGKGV